MNSSAQLIQKKKYLDNYLLTFTFVKDSGKTQLNIVCQSLPVKKIIMVYECRQKINGKYNIDGFANWIDDLQFIVQEQLKQICFRFDYFDAGQPQMKHAYLECYNIDEVKNTSQIKNHQKSEKKPNQKRDESLINNTAQKNQIQIIPQSLFKQQSNQNKKQQYNIVDPQMLKRIQNLIPTMRNNAENKQSLKFQNKLTHPTNNKIEKSSILQDKVGNKKVAPSLELQLKQKRNIQRIDKQFQNDYQSKSDDLGPDILQLIDKINTQQKLEQGLTSDNQEQTEQQQYQKYQQDDGQEQSRDSKKIQSMHDRTYLNMPGHNDSNSTSGGQLQKVQQEKSTHQEENENILQQVMNSEDDLDNMKSKQQIQKVQFAMVFDKTNQKFRNCYSISQNVIKVIQQDKKNILPIVGKLHATTKNYNTFTVNLKNIMMKQFCIGWVKLKANDGQNFIQNWGKNDFEIKVIEKSYLFKSSSGTVYVQGHQDKYKKMMKCERGWSIQCLLLFNQTNGIQIKWNYYDSASSQKDSISIKFQIEKDKLFYYYPYFEAKYNKSQFQIKKQ